METTENPKPLENHASEPELLQPPVTGLGEAEPAMVGCEAPPTASSEPLPQIDAPAFEKEAEDAIELNSEELALREGVKNRIIFVKSIRKRLRNDKDAILILTGERGIGKSRLADLLASEIDKGRFDRKTHTLFDPQVSKLKDIIYGFPKYSALVVDELIRIGYRRNWFKQGNKVLVELYNLCRYQNEASVLCIPDFSDIDSDLQDLVTFWVFVVNRGVAVVFRSDKNPFVKDKWHMNENERLLRDEFKGKPLHFFTDAEFLRALNKVPNFVCWFTFEDWAPGDKEEYDKLKVPYEMHKDDADKDNLKKAVRERIKKAEQGVVEAALVLWRDGYSMDEIEGMTGMARQKIGALVKEFKGKSWREQTKDVKRKNRRQSNAEFLSEAGLRVQDELVD